MTIIKCKECNSEVSSKADTCPKCGIRIASKPIKLGKIFLFLLFIGISFFVFYKNNTPTFLPISSDQSTLSTDKLALVTPEEKNLLTATDKALNKLLPILTAPFHRPFQYIGMSVASASKSTGIKPNKVNNITVDSKDANLYLEAEGNFISFVEIELKKTSPCSQSVEFDPEPILGALSINPSELELVKNQTHLYVYSDHKRKLKVSVTCLYDGAPISVSFSSKYYGM